jgi:ankyrin repeat protein
MRALVLLALAGALCAADRPAISEAARSGDHATLRALIEKKSDINATEGDGGTALLWASYRDDAEAARILLAAGARVNAANDLGATPLWIACQNGSVTMARLLLDAGANPNLALSLGETPLMVASRAGSSDVVELLLAHGANANARAARDQTALMWAVAEKHPEVVKALLRHGADFHAKSAVWTEVMAVPPHGYLPYNRAIPHGGETALMFAARVDDLPSARLLVAAGADVNDQDAWGVSAVTLAAHSGFFDVMDFLLAKGADPDRAAAGFTALQIAVMRRDEKMAADLLDHGADPNAPLKTWTPTRRSSHDLFFHPAMIGATPFWLAARLDEPGMMRLLLAHGANAKFVLHSEWRNEKQKPQSESTTALMAAVGMGGGAEWFPVARGEREALALEAAKIAVATGVDVNASDNDGRTALDAAQKLKYASVIAFLAEKGARGGGANSVAR